MNYEAQRKSLAELLKRKGCTNQNVLNAIRKVPREKFVSKDMLEYSYEDTALRIECNQTISQPYIVAMMTQMLLARGPVQKVLEIGTGSGYQAAILSCVVDNVYTIERYKFLYETAKEKLKEYENVNCLHRDGYLGWKEHAPYDAIIITAAVDKLPKELMSQLADNAIVVYPREEITFQRLILIEKKGSQVIEEKHEIVMFVPMVTGTD